MPETTKHGTTAKMNTAGLKKSNGAGARINVPDGMTGPLIGYSLSMLFLLVLIVACCVAINSGHYDATNNAAERGAYRPSNI